MVQLMIIADDFTGALDTGVHFSEKGIRTRVIVSMEENRNWAEVWDSNQAVVLVIDAETRHVSKERAFQKVYEIVAEGKRAGIPYIYKKTDSALRGNIGSELEAAYRASGEKILSFVPALPQMNRITKGGRQYIDGSLVSQSVFGADPFEPVTEDSVKALIHLQSNLPVQEAGSAEQAAWDGAGIIVFDAETENDLWRIGERLKAAGCLHILAGCAGFASILPDLLELECRTPESPVLEEKLFVLCGSVNPITKRQLERGEKAGYPRVYLTPEEKLERDFWQFKAGEEKVRLLAESSRRHGCVMLDSNDPAGIEKTLDYAKAMGMEIQQVRQRISETLGVILKRLMDYGLHAVLLVTGGDTLLGLMKEISQWELQPVRELRPGCVLTKLFYNSREYHVITKSGGFGEETLLLELVKELEQQKK